MKKQYFLVTLVTPRFQNLPHENNHIKDFLYCYNCKKKFAQLQVVYIHEKIHKIEKQFLVAIVTKLCTITTTEDSWKRKIFPCGNCIKKLAQLQA